MYRGTALTCLIVAVVSSVAHAQNLTVVSVSPTPNAGAPANTPIVVQFDRPLLPATVTTANFWAFGRWSGSAEGTLALSNGDSTITLTPNAPFSAGEVVTVYMSNQLRGADTSPMRQGGYSFQFGIKSAPAAMDWQHRATMTTRTIPTQTTRAYGGVATDLNNDGWLDLTIVQEDTADLRVFMNLANGSGLYSPFIQPTFPVQDRASPSEPGDFNRDGKTDICVCNINANTVSILLGNGNGTYAPQQIVAVGQAPRGIAVLDVDGDGDQDIVNTNANSSNVSILLNNGSGVFGAPTFFEGGGTGEWSLGTADMNGNGLLDLVIGARTNQRMIVARNNGNGTFLPLSPQSSGGATWMIALGDVNADGKVDVVSANSTNNNAAVLLGDGLGGLGPPQTYATDPFCLATDLGDLDGDGDLDWNVSSFNGDWWFFLNNGNGVFTFHKEIDAPVAASCALFLDSDNDGDIDLALIDELADVVILYRNRCYADCNEDDLTNLADFGCFQTKFATQNTDADCNGDAILNLADFGCFQTKFALGCP